MKRSDFEILYGSLVIYVKLWKNSKYSSSPDTLYFRICLGHYFQNVTLPLWGMFPFFFMNPNLVLSNFLRNKLLTRVSAGSRPFWMMTSVNLSKTKKKLLYPMFLKYRVLRYLVVVNQLTNCGSLLSTRRSLRFDCNQSVS